MRNLQAIVPSQCHSGFGVEIGLEDSEGRRSCITLMKGFSPDETARSLRLLADAIERDDGDCPRFPYVNAEIVEEYLATIGPR